MNCYRIIQLSQSYTFRKYFELPFAPEDILTDIGYFYERDRLQLPQVESVSIEEPKSNLKPNLKIFTSTLPFRKGMFG